MHRKILGLKYGDGKLTDHVNNNGLDNCRCNIRICTSQQNQHNQRRISKGCCWHKPAKKWEAYITVNKKQIHLGLFDNEKDAHKAYLCAKQKYHSI